MNGTEKARAGGNGKIGEKRANSDGGREGGRAKGETIATVSLVHAWFHVPVSYLAHDGLHSEPHLLLLLHYLQTHTATSQTGRQVKLG